MNFYEVLDEMFQNFEEFKDISKGKGVRGTLITTISPKSVKLAAVVEAVHLASLLHDDVIDEAELRRGVKSINAKYGDFTAVMLGDIIYSRAFYELTSFGEEIAKIISNAVYLLSQGELEDVKLSKEMNLDKNKYMQMIYKKTASLIEASCKAAAAVEKLDTRKFALYGKNIGLAFQIIDDLLDITQDEKTLGKPSMLDFKEGKMTLPYIYLYKTLNEKEKEKLQSMFKKDLNEKQKSWIKEKMMASGIIEKCYSEAREMVDEAKNTIKEYDFPKLQLIADKIINRKF